MNVRRKLYDSGILRSFKLPCAVVSIGNLRMGGTGKTPFIMNVLEQIESLQESPLKGRLCVVSRNYKAQSNVMGAVDLRADQPHLRFGDEPTLIKSKFPQIPIFVGPNKLKSAELAFLKMKPALILIDDGFQHLALQRDIDVVLIAPEDLAAGVFPFGMLRESLAAVIHAKFVVLVDFTDENRNEFELQLSKIDSRWRERLRILSVKKSIKLLDADVVSARRDGWAAFAGIGKPEVFFRSLESLIGVPPVELRAFPNHADYSSSGIRAKLSELNRGLEMKRFGQLFTTEKDAIKLREKDGNRLPLRVVGLELRSDNSMQMQELLHEMVQCLEKKWS